MSTNFVPTVKSSAGDYSSLNAALVGAGTIDFTAATVKVFSISSVVGAGPAPGDSLLGLTSAATGTCVLVNAAQTQILIKAISGTFQSGETVKKLTDPTLEVVLSNAGDSANYVPTCFGFVDTTAVVSGSTSAITTGTNNRVRCIADSTAVATMPYTSTGYRLEFTVSAGTPRVVNSQTKFFSLERLSFKMTCPASAVGGQTVAFNGVSAGGQQVLLQCYVSGVMHASDTSQCVGYKSIGAHENAVIVNCLFTGYTNIGNGTNTAILCAAAAGSYDSVTVYNTTIYKCAVGISNANATLSPRLVNNLYDRGGLGVHTGYSTTGGAFTGNNNASTEADAPGTANRNSQTFTYVNAATDWHLGAGDTGATGFGADLSGDGTYAFSSDFDGTTRTVPWDIGCSIAAPPGVVLPPRQITMEYQSIIAQ